MTSVLVVDDDPAIRRILRLTLRAYGYQPIDAENGTVALEHVFADEPDIVLLDLGLPDMDGMNLLTGLRSAMRAPILVISGRSGAADKITALNAGADDYITKPFEIGELVARVRACSRRADGGSAAPVQIGDVTVNIQTRTATRDAGKEHIRLTPTEWRLLEALISHPGMLVGRAQLLATAWGPQAQDKTHYLRLYMARLRSKLEPDQHHPRHLLTESGMGYRFQP